MMFFTHARLTPSKLFCTYVHTYELNALFNQWKRDQDSNGNSPVKRPVQCIIKFVLNKPKANLAIWCKLFST